MTTATKAATCQSFLPGDIRDGVLRCDTCLIPIDRHPPFRDLSLYEVASEIHRLLTHYGHHCTVQNKLPELTRALAREYGR